MTAGIARQYRMSELIFGPAFEQFRMCRECHGIVRRAAAP